MDTKLLLGHVHTYLIAKYNFEIMNPIYLWKKSHDSSVGIVLDYRLDSQCSGVQLPAGLGIFLFTIMSRMALGLTQPPVQWVPGALSLGVKWLGCEADHSPPSSAKVRECMELYLHSPNKPSWRGA
jgi:hypothetical protein